MTLSIWPWNTNAKATPSAKTAKTSKARLASEGPDLRERYISHKISRLDGQYMDKLSAARATVALPSNAAFACRARPARWW